jgi:hypothetical protein
MMSEVHSTEGNTIRNPILQSDLIPSQTIPKKRTNRRAKPKQQNAALPEAQNMVSNETNTDELESRDNSTIIPRRTNGMKGNRNKKTTKQGNKKDISQEGEKSVSKGPKRNKKNKNKHSWKQLLPIDAVDPISLEPLSSLHYPPFALTISPPYEPILEWPVVPKKDTTECKEGQTKKETTDLKEEAKKREQQVMEEQWGALLLSQKKSTDITLENEIPSSTQKHYHLFDGKVLAYYLVSTLQFIDPLNRRDLTRQEISNLDAYLAKHQLKKMRVLEAYDEKGISLSSAGANAQSQSGRLRIRQEEARTLLNSLFSDSRGRDGDRQPSRQRGRNQSQNRQDRESHRHTSVGNSDLWNQSEGIWGDESSGLIIIDDDLNPGLRSGLNNAVQLAASDNGVAPSNWQPNYLAQQYGHHVRARADNFPSLPTPSVEREVISCNQNEGSNQKGVSKSLSRIGKLVQKTDPKQVEKQRKAREEAIRKAELSRLTVEDAFRSMEMGGDQTLLPSSTNGVLQVPISTKAPEPSQGQIERNRNLAEALGVTPSTIRQQLKSGWARPTTFEIEKDEFGNELNATQYPDSLISEARDRMTDLLRIEKKWKSFLEDDKAASCNLKPMDKPSRKFFHEYSDFWNLQTQSFDPAPKRYIQCTKTNDTIAPYPFLSDAVRSWKGPSLVSQSRTNDETIDVPLRSLENNVERVPLKLAPRSIPAGLDVPVGTMYDVHPMSGFDSASAAQEPAARFAPILEERERPKLVLDPRTKPLELPPIELQQKVDALSLAAEYKKEIAESMKKKKMQEEKKKKILASAFASDDESAGTESVWEEEDAMVSGSDEED